MFNIMQHIKLLYHTLFSDKTVFLEDILWIREYDHNDTGSQGNKYIKDDKL